MTAVFAKRLVMASFGSFLILGLGTQAAHARPDSRSMTCDQARKLVKKKGAVVMNTGPNTYDRYVYSRQYCVSIQQFLIRATVPTRDNKQCRIGYLCQQESPLYRGY